MNPKLNHLIPTLQNALKEPLPGQIAHKKMARFGRRFNFNHDVPPKLAGVMILLYPKADNIYFVLMERQGHPLDPHQHQISLPGGKKETNETLEQTAFRETYEEIGVHPDLIHIIGPLSTVFVGVSNFLIHPFIGIAREMPIFTPEIEEVKTLLEVPLNDILTEKNIKVTDMVVRGYELKDVPYFDLAEKVVWGATAMVLSEFREILGEVGALRF